MSLDPCASICGEHLAAFSAWQSHATLPLCPHFSYPATFELTLQGSAHLFLACCCDTVLWISHLVCPVGNAAALCALFLPSPLFMPLHRETVSQDEVESLLKLFLQTCFFQTPTRYLGRQAFASSSSLFILKKI